MRRKQYGQHVDVKADFPKVIFIGPRRAVLHICRNAYRLVVDVRYYLGRVYIRHLVTHAAYDRLTKQKRL